MISSRVTAAFSVWQVVMMFVAASVSVMPTGNRAWRMAACQVLSFALTRPDDGDDDVTVFVKDVPVPVRR